MNIPPIIYDLFRYGFFTLYFLVLLLTPSLLLFALFTWVVLFGIKKVKKLKKSQEKMIIALFAIIYLLIGVYLYLDYLWLPNKYDPGYLSWLRGTPLWEHIVDITAWPVLYLQRFF